METAAAYLPWIGKILKWLASPSIIPWTGAVAAIMAALTVEPKTWLKSPTKSVARTIRVAAVWLLMAWMLSSAAQFGSADGTGDSEGDATQTPVAASATPSVPVIPGPFPSRTPEHVDLIITFLPSAANGTAAQDFSCDLVEKGTQEKIEIRARSMGEFDKLLVQQLRRLILLQGPRQPTVVINRSPFPGEAVVLRVRERVRSVAPKAEVLFDK